MGAAVGKAGVCLCLCLSLCVFICVGGARVWVVFGGTYKVFDPCYPCCSGSCKCIMEESPSPITPTPLPPNPPLRLRSPPPPVSQQEQQEKEQRQKEKAEAHLYCSIKVATDDHIREQVCGEG